MNKVFKINFLYFSLLCFIILNLSCEQGDSYIDYNDIPDNHMYSFSIDHEIEGVLHTGKDFADTDEDYTEITIQLYKTLNGNDFSLAGMYKENFRQVSVFWEVSNTDFQSIPKIEYNGTEISNGGKLDLDEEGKAILKWLDKGISGDVTITCSYEDGDGDVWSSNEQNNQSFETFCNINEETEEDVEECSTSNTFTITPVTYSLDVTLNPISDNASYTDDYSDFTNLDKIYSGNTSYTEVNISLSKNEMNLPSASKLVTINLINNPNGHFLSGNSEDFNSGGQILTDSEGNIKLYWIDEGHSGFVQFTTIYYPILDNSLYSVDSFEVKSQYEKVDEIVPYVFNSINLTDGSYSPGDLNTIEVRVIDEADNGVEYIDVHINPGTCVNCPQITWIDPLTGLPTETVSQTDNQGIAKFHFTLSNEGAVLDDVDLSYTFTISNDNLICNLCLGNELNSSTEIITFELDEAVAPEEPVIEDLEIFELRLEPSVFIFNDLPEAVNDSTYSDSIIIEATAKTAEGHGIENLFVHFESMLPQSGNSYGTLQPTVSTNSDGVAINVLKNINTDNLTASNPIDTILVKATITNSDTTYEKIAQSIIIPKSLQNISEVNDLDFSFDQTINFTIDANGTFSDNLTAQVLNEDGSGVEGVPIQFSLSTNDVGYISSSLEYSDSQGFATTTYNINGSDISTADGNQATINVSAYINDQINETLDRTYYVDPLQLISSVELNLTPNELTYNDLPGSEPGTVDTIGISVYVKDANGVGVSQIPVSFANNTPQYGILQSAVVNTNSEGIALNRLSNINTSTFDFENNNTENIEISIETVGIDQSGFETLYTATSVATIVPQSLQNIWQVDQLDVYFAQQLSTINNVTVAFSDTVVAQVLNDNLIPVEGVPVNFELVSVDSVGYLTSQTEISDSLGFARSIFHINPADFSNFDNDITTITVHTTVGEDFIDSITKSYEIEGNINIEYEVAELYPVTYEPLGSFYDFDVNYNSELDAYQHQFKDLCFQAKDSDGVKIEQVPIQFALSNSASEPFGTISDALLYSCCQWEEEDSTSNAALFPSNSMSYYNYMYQYILETYDDDEYAEVIASDTSGVACIRYSAYDISENEFDSSSPDNLIVTIADPNNQSVNLHENIYTLGLNALQGPQSVNSNSFDLVMDPEEILIYNDLPANIDTTITDIVGLSVLVRDEDGSSISNIKVDFTNLTDYGALEYSYVNTDSNGVAENNLYNITATFNDVFDYEKLFDSIKVKIDAYDDNEIVATDSNSIIIIPQSIYNINQVDELALTFVNPTNVTIYEVNNTIFSDEIQAQVLTESSSPFKNVPIEFSLTSDYGYIPSSLEYSDDLGIASIAFQLTPANISQLANGDGTLDITINATVGGDAYSQTITRTYTIIPIPTIGSIDLDIELDTLIFNDLPESVDPTPAITEVLLIGTVKDDLNTVLSDEQIYYNIPDPNHANFGDLSNNLVTSDFQGFANTTLTNIDIENFNYSNISQNIIIEMSSVTDPEIPKALDTLVIIPQSIANIYRVDDISLDFSQNINFIISTEGAFSDTLIAQALNQYNVPISGVPIQFSLGEDNIGYISQGEVYTDAQGFASTVYNIYGQDIVDNGGNETTIDVTAFINEENNVTIERTYQINPAQLISSVELNLTPEVLIYNDIPGFETGTVDTIGISVYVKDDNGVGISQIPISFANNTPNYGILESAIVNTNNDGIAINKLSNINTSSFDFENNTTDNIEITIETVGIDESGFETLYTATSVATIVPQSLQNIWQVNNLDVYFANEEAIINDISIAFSDTIVAQVLDEYANPVEGVPMSFELISNDIGYLTIESSFSNSNGFVDVAFNIEPTDFSNFVGDNSTITINATVGESFTSSVSKTYVIGNIEYQVAELYSVTYEPLDFVYGFDVNYNNQLEAYENQSKDLCFQAKDSLGIILENVPIQFALNSNSNGSLSGSSAYSCCQNPADSTSMASQDNSNTILYYNYMIGLGLPESTASDTLGIACITYNVYDIGESDFENPDNLTVSILNPNNPDNNLHEITYTLGLNPLSGPQSVDSTSFDLVMYPEEILIYNDLPANIDPTVTDSVGLSVLVRDEDGSSIPNIQVNFTNLTEYGALQYNSVNTGVDGLATNKLYNIAATFDDAFDYENDSQDIIRVQIDAIDNNEIVATDSDSIIIVPQSIYNINEVDQLTLTFVEPTNFTIYQSDNATFTDEIQAQVLTATNSPFENVPIEFSLTSDYGYIPSSLEYSNDLGIASVAFQLTPANISQLANGDGTLTISINATVGNNHTETIERTYTIVPLSTVGSIDLDIALDTLIFNDLPASVDSTDQITEIGLQGITRDSFDAVVGGITATFEIIDGGEYADLETASVVSDSLGYANNKLVNIDTEEFDFESSVRDSIKVRMSVTDSDNQELSDTAQVIIIPKSIANIAKVDQLDTYFTQELNIINNVSITISDTVIAQVLDEASTPVLDVPINFDLSSPNNIGYITNQIDYSDSTGYAYTIYKITPADFNDFDETGSETITINASVGDNITVPITRTYVIDASANIEYEVEELSHTTNSVIPIIGYPDSVLVEQYNDITEKFCFSTTDESGVSISGVPIQFELFNDDEIRGSLNSSLLYTYPDSSYDAQNDTTCTNTTLGSACVCYNLPVDITSFDNLPDSLRAHIPDPNNQDIDLKSLTIGIDIISSSSLVDLSFAYAQPSFIAMDVLDSTYCDTIYAIAQNEESSPLKDIPVLFELDEADFEYGLLSTNYAVTDSLPYPPYIAATTQFCTHPNIDLEGEDVVIDIITSVQLSEYTDTVQIPLSENIPECPDCEESLVITSDYYELPNIDIEGNNVFQANLTATVVDSTENPVPENTLVEWQALKEDETGALTEVIGSIDPYTFTDENGVATTIFSMMNDFGLASIIATAPAFNLADTTFISITSNDAAYIELIQPVPNEIMVQGGGGIESTELQVEVKDNNGNLVTDDYVVYYRLANNSPSGTYFNEIGTSRTCVNSDNGIASVTLNSGNEPGSVQVIVAAYPLDSDCESIECTDGNGDGLCDDSGNSELTLDSSIAQLSFTTVTIVTGPPSSGQINFSYVDILPITGSGLYEVPLSVQLEDLYANPVADSTNVYIWIEGHKPHWCTSENVADEVNFPGLENEDCTFAVGDTVKWGTDAIIDSLLYVLVSDIPFQQPLSEGLNFAPGQLNGQQFWLELAHPGQVVGEAKTGMVAPDGNSYPGIAFSNAYYGTSEIFERTVLKAMTFGANEEMLVIDSRDNHMGEPLLLPFQPGTVSATTSLVTFDFSLPPHNPDVGPACDNGVADTQQVTVTGSLTDFFQYATGDGRLQITAPGATIISACNPSDTDGDGFVGWCDEDGNGLQGDEELIPTCRDCVAAQLPWIFDDSDGDGLVDDDPAVGITDGTGQVVFIIEFSEVINIQSGPCDAPGGDIVTYDDWQSDVVLQLIDPIQTASNSITITVQKTETD